MPDTFAEELATLGFALPRAHTSASEQFVRALERRFGLERLTVGLHTKSRRRSSLHITPNFGTRPHVTDVGKVASLPHKGGGSFDASEF